MDYNKPSLCIKLVKGNITIGAKVYLKNLSFSDMINYTMKLVDFYTSNLHRYSGTNDILFAMLFFHMTTEYVKAWEECSAIPEKSLELFKDEMGDEDIFENVKNIDKDSRVGIARSDIMLMLVNSKKTITIDLDAKSVRLDKNMFMPLKIVEYAYFFGLNSSSIDLNMFPVINVNPEIPLEKAHEIFYTFKVNLQGFKTKDDAEDILVPIPQRI